MVATDRLFVLVDACSNVEEVAEHFPELDFLTYLFSILGFYHVSTNSLMGNLDMEETAFYEIIDGKTSPNRDQIIQLAKAVYLDIKKTNFLLHFANERVLDPKDPRDGLIIFSIKNHYTLKETNHILTNCNLQDIK